jgi:hypothetical protein
MALSVWREVVSWSSRPTGPRALRREGQPVPDGLNWDLWLGQRRNAHSIMRICPSGEVGRLWMWRAGRYGFLQFDTIFRVLKLEA